MNNKQEPQYVPVEETIQGTSGESTEMTVAPQKFEAMRFLSPDEMPDLSDDNVEVGPSLAPKYYEGFIKAGDTVRGIFNGITITHSRKNLKPGDPPKEIPTVVFQNKDGVYLHSGANLVQQLTGFPVGKPIQITFLGAEKTQSGNNVNKFEVRVLNIQPF